MSTYGICWKSNKEHAENEINRLIFWRFSVAKTKREKLQNSISKSCGANSEPAHVDTDNINCVQCNLLCFNCIRSKRCLNHTHMGHFDSQHDTAEWLITHSIQKSIHNCVSLLEDYKNEYLSDVAYSMRTSTDLFKNKCIDDFSIAV